MIGERCGVEPETTSGVDLCPDFSDCCLQGLGVDRPSPDVGFSFLAREEVKFVGVDPAPFGDDSIDRAIRVRDRSFGLGVDI